jgi:hypothetical protein
MFERHRKGLAVTGAALLAALGVGGIAAAQNSAQPSSPPAVVKQQSAPKANAAESTTGPDTDSIQSGDQTTPDKPGASAPSTSSSSASEAPGQESSETPGQESGSEAPNSDGPGGHADEPGSANADHQFDGAE